MNIRTLGTDYDKTEDDIKALQSVGQIIGEILKQLDDERCKLVQGDRANNSHRQSLLWSQIRCLLQTYPARSKGET